MTAFLANFCDFLLMTSIIPLFPMLGYSEVATGLLFSCKAMVQMVTAPLFSTIIDRYPLQLLILGLVTDICATLTFATEINYTTWFIARSVQGFASAAILPSCNAIIQRVYTHDEPTRVKAFGISTGGIIAGVVIGPPVGGVLFSVNPALPFVSTAFLLSITAMCAVYVMRTTPLPSLEKAKGESAIMKLLADPFIRTTLGALFFANFGISAFQATFGVFAINSLGLSLAGVGVMYMWGTVPSIIASTTIGPFLYSLGMDKWKIVCLGLLSQGSFFMLGPKAVPALMRASFVGQGFGMGLTEGMCPSLLSLVADKRHKGTTAVHSVSVICVQSSFVAGPILGSWISQYTGFWGMCALLGSAMVFYMPSLRALDDWETQADLEEAGPLLHKGKPMKTVKIGC